MPPKTGLIETELEALRRLVRDRELELDALIEESGDIVVQSDAEGRITRANRAYKETLGFGDRDLRRQTVFALLRPADQERFRKLFDRVLAGKTVRDVEFTLVAEDGSEIPVTGTLRPRSKDGKPVAVLGVYSDLRHRRLLERLRQEFFHQVNHELKNPLTLILGGLHVVRQDPTGLSPQQQRWLEMVERHAGHLRAMIDDLQELMRSETGKLIVSPELVNLAPFTLQIAEDYAPAAEKKRITLRTQIPPDLPQALADRSRYRQILGNLIDNALKFTPDGGTVKVRLDRSEGTLLTSVSDTGPGISSVDLGMIFEPLYQAGAQFTTQRKGLGLGLAICRSLVGRQGGRIWAESIPGKGAAFHFTLPVSEG